MGLQHLAEHHQPDHGGQRRVDAHEHPEEAGRDPAQRDQVGGVRDGGAEQPDGDAAEQGDADQPAVQDEQHHDGQVAERGHRGGRGGRLQAREATADQAVEHDVGRPAAGGQQGEAHPQPVGGRAREHEDVDPDPGHDGADEVGRRARADEGHGQRPEELQRRRQAQVDAAEGRVEAQVHRGEDHRQQQRRPPLGPGEAAERRPGDRQQHRGGDQLAHGDDPGHPDGGVREGAHGRAHLRRRRAPGHGEGAAEQAGARAADGGRHDQLGLERGHGRSLGGPRTAGEMHGGRGSIRSTHDRRPAPAAGPGRGGRGGHVHRRGDRARHVPGVGVAGGGVAGGRPGCPGAVPHDPPRGDHRGRGTRARPRAPGARRRRRAGTGGCAHRRGAAGRLRLVGAGGAHGTRAAPVGGRPPGPAAGLRRLEHPDRRPRRGPGGRRRAAAAAGRPALRRGAGGQRGPLRRPAQHRPARPSPHREAGGLRRPHARRSTPGPGPPASTCGPRAPRPPGTARCTGSRTCSPSWSPARPSA